MRFRCTDRMQGIAPDSLAKWNVTIHRQLTEIVNTPSPRGRTHNVSLSLNHLRCLIILAAGDDGIPRAVRRTDYRTSYQEE